MKIVQKMAIAYKDWLEVLPFSLLGSHASVHISTGATSLPSLNPDNRSSAEVQAGLNLKCMTNLVQPCQERLKQTSNKKIENPKGRSMQKLRIKRQSNCIRSGTIHLGHPTIKKTSDSKHLQIKDSEQGHSKLLGRIAVIVFNVPSHTFTIFQIFQRSVEPCPW
ncbi:hypothetical protein MTR_0357s0030 [Medicago truncatula]|uniref:Uncharacterized protein n=1 Tax=Medicago truncatula TaxID=3880 RepID=A0A072TF95_MEDTR|nr:hypothetical protein MTR_0357s0030 [Medicago truncatula]